jgi:uncharacterized protein YjbJ (UPF0337 family)
MVSFRRDGEPFNTDYLISHSSGLLGTLQQRDMLRIKQARLGRSAMRVSALPLARRYLMSDDRVVGSVKEGIGRVQDAAGGLLGDDETQAKGKVNEVVGSVQQTYGQVKDQAQDALRQAGDTTQTAYGSLENYVRDQPLPALAIGVGVGFLLGLLIKGSGKNS